MASEDTPAANAVLVRDGLSPVDAESGLLALAALGVAATIVVVADGSRGIAVDERDRRHALEVLDLADADRAAEGAASKRSDRIGEVPATGARDEPWFGRDTLVVPALAALCALVYLVVSGGRTSVPWERMVRAGAIAQGELERGELWRLASAVFLHFDLEHLLSNMVTLLFVGPIVARAIGPWRFLAVFLLAGIAGNAASWAIVPPLGLRAGASGGVAGVIGALAGEALAGPVPRRFARWQVLGALAAIYALLVGAGPRSDHVAHLAGLLAGIALGRMFARRSSLVDPTPGDGAVQGGAVDPAEDSL